MLCALALYAYHWYENQPKPQVVDFDLIRPERTKVEVNAKPDPLKLKFASSVAPMEQIEKIITSGVELYPKIEGTWRWESDSLLVFTPKANWAIGQKYRVTLDPKYFRAYNNLGSTLL